MARYLNHIDALKEEYITLQNSTNSATYPSRQYHYYENISYNVDNSIVFVQTLCAVKLVKTSILFIDPNTNAKVYFTDNDIVSIIASIKNPRLKKHILDGLNKVISKQKLETLFFEIGKKPFKMKGVSFAAEFNEIYCKNPADITMNGNDLIALINLILEKERADKNKKKLSETAKKYIGLT